MPIRTAIRSFTQLALRALLFLLLLGIVSCSPTRRISEGEYLFARNKVKLDSKDLDANEVIKYEKQSSNKTILGLRFHLFLYNLASPEREKFPSSWFRKIGEAPVIWDPILTEQTSEAFMNYVKTKGYYNAVISDTVYLNNKKKKAKADHQIKLNQAHRIRSITYDFEDKSISDLILSDTINSLLHREIRFDKELIQEERQRLEDLLKENGYYKFSKEYIYFEAREAKQDKLVDVEILFKENVSGRPDPETKARKHTQYKIGQTFVYPNFTLYSNMQNDEEIFGDTVVLEDSRVIYADKQMVRPVTVLMPNHNTPASLYRLSNVKKSYTNYSSLGLFRIINISFQDAAYQTNDTSEFNYLDCFIELSPRKRQAYQVELVGSNSDLDLGVRGNISYNNYNFFRGAENFQLVLTLAREWGKKTRLETGQIRSLTEVGIQSSITFPIFLVPFKAQRFSRKYNPRTTVNVAYSYQDRPEYLRTIASTAFGYRWKAKTRQTHNFLPVDFNFVRVGQDMDSAFRSSIENTKLQSSFENHMILASRYVFEYSNQVAEKLQDFVYFRTSLESAGNIVSLFTDDSLIFKVPYFQYLRYDVDFRFNKQITAANRIVYRLFAGIGVPLGKSATLPFERLYFAGGPYGIRAWNSEGLGPGTYNSIDSNTYYNRGELKLEANLEYRFKLFWKVEGALFVDAGNIWTSQLDDTYPGGKFEWNSFYKEIAVGTGIGVRFDLSFLILRTDFGFKMRDPVIQQGSRWVDFNQSAHYTFRDRFVFQFGIGYPF